MPAIGAAVIDHTISRGVVNQACVAPRTGGGTARLQMFPAHRIGQMEDPHVAEVARGAVPIEHDHLISQRVVDCRVRLASGWLYPFRLGPPPSRSRIQSEYPSVVEVCPR